jgi:sigma-B regulation protein RsbU (phosphoserine phosphatase)
MAFIGRFLKDYRIFAMYPVSKVKEQIDREKSRLIFAGIASLLITLILGQFLAHSFLFPLQKLHAGAEAIRARNFSMRLPPLGRDEFGEMAEIFNTTMVDLEELKVAGAIQEHLLPRQMPDTGKLSIYGKIISMGELGGDYYDYFNTSPGRFSVLIGDVAGRGAGAALIMAMAKAAIMQFENYHEKPDELAMHLHEMLSAAARSTQKTMIMQYLNFDSNTGKAIYTNAGGWPPLIINPGNKSVREVELPGPMLGAMKKTSFGKTNIELQPGEAIVLYSDGVIEARNNDNEILGLQRLKEMAIAAWHPDPEQHFAALLALHRQFTGMAPAQDDITLLIVSFAEKKQVEQTS